MWLNLNHCEYKSEEFTLALKPHGPVRLDRQWETMSITVMGQGYSRQPLQLFGDRTEQWGRF